MVKNDLLNRLGKYIQEHKPKQTKTKLPRPKVYIIKKYQKETLHIQLIKQSQE